VGNKVILDTIANASRIRVENQKKLLPLLTMKSLINDGMTIHSFNNRGAFAFETALRRDSVSFICEVKKASPSKGILVENFPHLTIAKEYEEAGAAAISVLTEPEYFKGSDRYLSDISRQVGIPVLRKDFTVDEYQLYEAKYIGADAILLITSLLEEEELKKYIKICDDLGLSALVEVHTKEEVFIAVNAGARVIGVNNRNLRTFEVDMNNSISLRSLVPENIVFVAESGIKTPQDIALLKEAGVNAVLIGETLMKSEDKTEMLSYLQGK
jgi:indole-3-glycerol phosphate synthase